MKFAGAAGEAEKDFFERESRCASLQGSERVAGEQTAVIDDGDAIGEALDFREGVGGEENGSGAGLQDLRFEKAAELGCGDDVDAARGLV